MTTSDDRQFAPATQRNRDSILQVLLQVLPPTGTILEISSGTGEHAVYFAPQLAPRRWQPSDPSEVARSSIAAWREFAPTENLAAPITIDARDTDWKISEPISAIVNINMIHISPWSACLGLLAGANRLLAPGGILYLYGPYKRNGVHTAPSNEMFDESLQLQDPEWGVRNLEDIITVAQDQNLDLLKIVEMPANNLSIVFCKS
jgi:hypothetical protein